MGSSECGKKREPKVCSFRWLGGKACPRVVYDVEAVDFVSESGGVELESTV